MKNKVLSKLILLIPSLFLTACGYSLRELYTMEAYNYDSFDENYYRVWDKSLLDVQNIETKDVTVDCFKTFSDDKFDAIESRNSVFDYENDIYTPNYGFISYGQTIKMSNYDESFRYGMISKLYDGQLFCNSKGRLSRIQIGESGFGTSFKKEGSCSSYFVMNFKGAIVDIDNSAHYDYQAFKMNITLKVKFYLKTSNGLTSKTYTSDLSVKANMVNTMEYVCYGFSLENENIQRLVGMSVEYNLNSLLILNNNVYEASMLSSNDINHALFLYEASFVNSSWN